MPSPSPIDGSSRGGDIADDLHRERTRRVVPKLADAVPKPTSSPNGRGRRDRADRQRRRAAMLPPPGSAISSPPLRRRTRSVAGSARRQRHPRTRRGRSQVPCRAQAGGRPRAGAPAARRDTARPAPQVLPDVPHLPCPTPRSTPNCPPIRHNICAGLHLLASQPPIVGPGSRTARVARVARRTPSRRTWSCNHEERQLVHDTTTALDG
jgi:hypothetical protein